MKEDLPLVRAWMVEAPEAPQWSDVDLAAVVKAPSADERMLRRGWIAELEELGPAGFAVATAVLIPGEPAECELEFVFVRPQARKRGIGGVLVRTIADWARSLKADEIRLEVRESNARALRLYESCGFAVVGRRSGYYADPTEDALQMCRLVND